MQQRREKMQQCPSTRSQRPLLATNPANQQYLWTQTEIFQQRIDSWTGWTEHFQVTEANPDWQCTLSSRHRITTEDETWTHHMSRMWIQIYIIRHTDVCLKAASDPMQQLKHFHCVREYGMYDTFGCRSNGSLWNLPRMETPQNMAIGGHQHVVGSWNFRITYSSDHSRGSWSFTVRTSSK